MELKSSFAEVSAARVLEACRAFIENRDASIQQEREAIIDADMRRWFFRPKSREEAHERRKRGDGFSQYRLAQLHGLYSACRVHELQSLAEMAKHGRMFVSAEDARLISQFMPDDEQEESNG